MTLIGRFACRRLCLGGLIAAAAAGCGGGSSKSRDGGPDSGAACDDAGTGMGTVTLQVLGLPAGSTGVISFSNGDTVEAPSVTPASLMLVAGSWVISASRVRVSDPIVSTVYEAISGAGVDSPVCVRAGQTLTVTVTYAKVASSNKLWAGNATGGTAPVLGFAAANLAASGTPAATVAATTAGSGGFTFDIAGNLWVVGGTSADPPLARYPAASLGTSGTKVADVKIEGDVLSGGSPGPVALAFDSSGGLWVSIGFSGQVVHFSAAQLQASGSPIPAVVLSAIDGPSGLAFDGAQDLWVAAAAGVLRFDAARLVTSTTGADATITANSPPPVIGPLPSPIGLAFDAGGNLWVNYDGTVARLETADLAGTGAVTVTPAVQVALDVASLPEGIAFDEGGGLWLAYTQGKLARLGPTQLTSSGTKTPGTVIDSADFGYARWVATYPAPATSPLYHRVP